MRITREVELLGGELSSSHSRENLVLSAKFLSGDLPYFAELLAEESASDYVFANVDTGKPFTDIGRVFAKACADVAIEDLTFHDLRHTFASRLREAGVDAITRRDLLGHSTVQMSDDYTHSSAESRLRAVQSIADYRKQDYSKITTSGDSEVSLRIAS